MCCEHGQSRPSYFRNIARNQYLQFQNKRSVNVFRARWLFRVYTFSNLPGYVAKTVGFILPYVITYTYCGLKVRKVNPQVAQREKRMIKRSNSQANKESQSEPYFKISNFSNLNNIKTQIQPNEFKLAFSRNGMSWNILSWCHFVSGQKYFLYPGTRVGAKIPGQTPLSKESLSHKK